VSEAHYTGDEVNELSAVGQYKKHRFETFDLEKYCDLETRVRVAQGHWK